jgi:hypothetical protein
VTFPDFSQIVERVSRAWSARRGGDGGRDYRSRRINSERNETMKSVGTFELMRIWAALTGVALALWYFGALYLGGKMTDLLPMLITGIGGFEMVLFAQDIWIKRKRHG